MVRMPLFTGALCPAEACLDGGRTGDGLSRLASTCPVGVWEHFLPSLESWSKNLDDRPGPRRLVSVLSQRPCRDDQKALEEKVSAMRPSDHAQHRSCATRRAFDTGPRRGTIVDRELLVGTSLHSQTALSFTYRQPFPKASTSLLNASNAHDIVPTQGLSPALRLRS
ncbi:hypothetical protein BV22DRAFT_843808 [Leucogyrophana mollusca]|uniref:Uncharacterized protein n=1 Tax=Leucogyrophana mollusca TaxID=85980 RepID=A0ACB8B329_9AGAM|nr:hypothetical protein BV22DRAFT_843808 [Leucogyrophana mollusca]